MTIYRLTDIDSDDYVRAAFSGPIPQVGVVEWINNTPGGLTQAPVNAPPIAPNPYPGTHFVADKEDAYDGNANRAHGALAEGIDDLDNIMHRAVAIPSYVDWTPAVGVHPTFTIPPGSGPVYLGAPMSPGNLDHISLVYASNHAAVLDGAGNRIVASGLVPGIGAGSLINGFSPGTGVDITWSAPVTGDAATVYRIYYGKKNSLGALGRGDLSRLAVFNTEAVGAAVQQVLKLLHAPAALGQQWNDPWQTTIYDVAFGGFNSRYNRATQALTDETALQTSLAALEWGIPDVTLDTPGGGSWLERTGPAPLSISHKAAGEYYLDKFDAMWRAVNLDVNAAPKYGGSSGFVMVGARGTFTGITATQRARGLAGFLHTTMLGMTSGSSYAPFLYTCVSDGAAGTLSWTTPPGSITTTELELTVDSADFFWKTVGVDSRTGICCGVDMIELRNVSGTQTGVYVIYALNAGNARKCYLRHLSGHQVTVASLDTDVTYRLHNVIHYTSDGVSEMEWNLAFVGGFSHQPAVQLYGSGYFQAPLMGMAGATPLLPPMPFSVWGTEGQAIPSLWWGGRALNVDPASDQTPLIPKGMLMPNGNVWAPGLFVDDIGRYDFMNPTLPIDVHSNIRLDTGLGLVADGLFTLGLAPRSGTGITCDGDFTLTPLTAKLTAPFVDVLDTLTAAVVDTPSALVDVLDVTEVRSMPGTYVLFSHDLRGGPGVELLFNRANVDYIKSRSGGTPVYMEDGLFSMGAASFDNRTQWVRSTELVSFITVNTMAVEVANADMPYRDIRVDGTWGGGTALWYLQLELNAAKLVHGTVHYVTVRGDFDMAGPGIQIEFVGTGGTLVVTDSSDPPAPKYALSASGGDQTATFKLFVAAQGGIAGTPAGKVVYVERMGQLLT